MRWETFGKTWSKNRWMKFLGGQGHRFDLAACPMHTAIASSLIRSRSVPARPIHASGSPAGSPAATQRSNAAPTGTGSGVEAAQLADGYLACDRSVPRRCSSYREYILSSCVRRAYLSRRKPTDSAFCWWKSESDMLPRVAVVPRCHGRCTRFATVCN